MPVKSPKRSPLRSALIFLAVVFMFALFSSSVLCAVLAYNTWSGSAVEVHRGVQGWQKTYMRLTDEEENRMYALIAGAVASALLGTGLFASLNRHLIGPR